MLRHAVYMRLFSCERGLHGYKTGGIDDPACLPYKKCLRLLFECLSYIGYNVAGVFDTDRETDQVGSHSCRYELFVR